MIRRSIGFAGAAAVAVLFVPMIAASGQQQEVPAAPPQDVKPSAPAPAAPVFPKPDPINFTAATPTRETIDGFLKASWGYDLDRVWQIQAILKTPVEGLSKVVVLVGDKGGKEKPGALQFFALPGGQYIVAGEEVVPFGDHPYASYRAMLQQRADGPYRGAAAKDLELVEFADFQCPHCKDAQASMDRLAVDFPKARIVYQNFPLEKVHPAALRAASYGACVTKLGGSTAFFQFAGAVFEGQEGLATADGATLTLNSAVTKAGLDPAKVSACAATPETHAEVENSVKLAQDLNVNQTPTLMVNGRQVPIGGLSYDTLKQIVEYQAKIDGVTQ
ncbi:MAG TPA: thioredoxin domain-containing protein [Terracidiphilus sp.]|nr:thioredoxin domain-containing protein [Terracidiphilus sp.]